MGFTHFVKPFRRLYEALRRPSGAFLTSTQETLGVYPEISFRTMTQVYLADLAARASIDFLADQISPSTVINRVENTYERSWVYGDEKSFTYETGNLTWGSTSVTTPNWYIGNNTGRAYYTRFNTYKEPLILQ